MNVVALISGGKDSFFSLLHCIANGHKIVALANLHPALEGPDDEDLNSYMYQTVGHSVIPNYQDALQIPLYRQAITGSALNVDKSYHPTARTLANDKTSEEDETEAIVPLLRRILAEHPEANALSSGAILSNYQRTRVESVAVRLGLTPLAYLWHYTDLPPGTQTALLDDMHAVGMDARIVKIASGGLDESFLWEDVTDPQVQRRLIRAMGRFGGAVGGAVLGEGGEFETIVLNGPEELWKKRIIVDEKARKTNRMGGGAAMVSIQQSSAVDTPASIPLSEQDKIQGTIRNLRIPGLLDPLFESILEYLKGEDDKWDPNQEFSTISNTSLWEELHSTSTWSKSASALSLGEGPTWIRANLTPAFLTGTAKGQMDSIVGELQEWLSMLNLTPDNILFTSLILRSMSTFPEVNRSYAKLFTKPNPPARVTIACGNTLPPGVDVVMSVLLDTDCSHRRGLHVQSRSYWAPSNIGPYSQAVSIPMVPLENHSDRSAVTDRIVYVAGQIPLEPASMSVARTSSIVSSLHTVLALQHLWRIGNCEKVNSWLGCIAFLAGNKDVQKRVCLASKAWTCSHQASKGEESNEEVDLWEEKFGPSRKLHSEAAVAYSTASSTAYEDRRPVESFCPPLYIIQVDELPRESSIEWSCIGVDQKEPLKWKVHSKDGLQLTSTALGQSGVGMFYSNVSSKPNSPENMFNNMEQLLKYGESLMPKPKGHCRVWSHVTVYIARPVDLVQLIRATKAQIVPCRSAWDSGGAQVAAVLVQRVQIQDVPANSSSSKHTGGIGGI